MKFEVLTVLNQIKHLYELPRNRERFEKYLYLLQGDSKDDMILPISAYNPMGKELAMSKVQDLMGLNAEGMVHEILQQINPELPSSPERTIQVAINLIDDVEGSWSSHAVTDFKNKFEFDGIIKRNFCTPIFWTSESITRDLIDRRIKEFVYRTVFWITNGKPKTLAECIEQEVFVERSVDLPPSVPYTTDIGFLEQYSQQHQDSDDYNLILNFFYGDKGTESLSFPAFGIPEQGGFELARHIAWKKKQEG